MLQVIKSNQQNEEKIDFRKSKEIHSLVVAFFFGEFVLAFGFLPSFLPSFLAHFLPCLLACRGVSAETKTQVNTW